LVLRSYPVRAEGQVVAVAVPKRLRHANSHGHRDGRCKVSLRPDDAILAGMLIR